MFACYMPSITPLLTSILFIVVFQDNYARKEPAECAQRVKTLYRELEIERVYKEYEEASYKEIVGLIEKEAEPAGLPKELFLEFANRIYKRNA